MKRYQVLLSFSGLHKITIDANSPEEAEEMAMGGEYEPEEVKDESEDFTVEGCEEL